MDRIVFLDIDGVLNHDAWYRSRGSTKKGATFQERMRRSIDPDCVRRLQYITERTGSAVVLSSSWRQSDEWEQIPSFLRSLGLSAPFLGRTPTDQQRHPRYALQWVGRPLDPLEPYPRGFEIQQWLDEHPSNRGRAIVILDDDPDMEHLVPQFVQTDFSSGGLQLPHVWDAVDRLRHPRLVV